MLQTNKEHVLSVSKMHWGTVYDASTKNFWSSLLSDPSDSVHCDSHLLFFDFWFVVDRNASHRCSWNLHSLCKTKDCKLKVCADCATNYFVNQITSMKLRCRSVHCPSPDCRRILPFRTWRKFLDSKLIFSRSKLAQTSLTAQCPGCHKRGTLLVAGATSTTLDERKHAFQDFLGEAATHQLVNDMVITCIIISSLHVMVHA